ncbi:MAG TPA: hypothetical protein VNY05_37790 [Candidatus Acidoferrales bacterium]|nr:hypothetical protein [Candidatus Acidoferrales bacterium]
MLQFRVDRGINPVRSMPKIQFVGLTASEAEGAIVGLIRRKNMPEIPKAPLFARTFVVSTPPGSAIYLDYSHFKNLIFVDSSIRYDGGPAFLENVRFINCSFSLKQAQPTIRFAEAVMSHGSTDFTQPLPDQG